MFSSSEILQALLQNPLGFCKQILENLIARIRDFFNTITSKTFLDTFNLLNSLGIRTPALNVGGQ